MTISYYASSRAAAQPASGSADSGVLQPATEHNSGYVDSGVLQPATERNSMYADNGVLQPATEHNSEYADSGVLHPAAEHITLIESTEDMQTPALLNQDLAGPEPSSENSTATVNTLQLEPHKLINIKMDIFAPLNAKCV